MPDQTIKQLEQRVTNLEAALHGLWALMRDHQAPALQDAVDDMMKEHFETSTCIGGFRRVHFDVDG